VLLEEGQNFQLWTEIRTPLQQSYQIWHNNMPHNFREGFHESKLHLLPILFTPTISTLKPFHLSRQISHDDTSGPAGWWILVVNVWKDCFPEPKIFEYLESPHSDHLTQSYNISWDDQRQRRVDTTYISPWRYFIFYHHISECSEQNQRSHLIYSY